MDIEWLTEEDPPGTLVQRPMTLADVDQAIKYMEQRKCTGQGLYASAMCRLSLPMARFLRARLQEAERERDEAWDNALSSLLHRTVTWHSPAVARPTPALCVATEEQEIGREQVRDEARSMLRDPKLRDYWRSHGAAVPEE